MDPRLFDLAEGGADDDEVAVVLKLRDGAAPAGVRVVARFGDIATCRVRRGSVLALHEDDDVVSEKAAAPLGPDVEPPHADAEEMVRGDERPPLPSGVSGRNVVVAVIDWGVDFTHADFRTSSGATRLLAIWDQRPGAAGSARAPSPYGYGRLLTREAIDAALRSPDPFAALGYDPRTDDAGDGTHGTHTLGIAAGNGRAGGPRGIAPDADLIFVHLAPWHGELEIHLADSVTLLEALDFVRHMAGERPWVANMSLGAHAGPHDATTPVEQALDHLLCEAPGRAIVQSAGNYFNKRIHAKGMLGPAQTGVFHLEIDGAARSPSEIDLWYSGRDRVALVVVAPDGSASERVLPGERRSLSIDGREVARVTHRVREPNNHDNNAHVIFRTGAPGGEWEVRVFADDVVNGRVEAWVERNDGAHNQARLAESDAIALGTTGTICNGYRTIAVGAIDARAPELTVAPFSSAGPTRLEDRRKPDLLAPGVRVRAPRSARGDARDEYVCKSGTSMSSPCVAGTIALMFEAAPRLLAIHETRALLLSTATPAPAGADRERVGNGVVDVVRAVEAARAVAPHAPPMAPMEEHRAPAEAMMSDDVTEAVARNGRGAFRFDPLGGEAGENVEARWNVDATAAAAATVDVVVHLHGFHEPSSDFLAGEAAIAGVDLVDARGAVTVRASRPTLALVPRGHQDRHHPNKWHWDLLAEPGVFATLVTRALDWLARDVMGLGAAFARGRLTLAAHSGGGDGVARLLGRRAAVDPDEILIFDGLYSASQATPVAEWVARRVGKSTALRILYIPNESMDARSPAGRWVERTRHGRREWTYDPPGSWRFRDGEWHLPTTEVYSRRVQSAIDRALASLAPRADAAAIARRFRVEPTSEVAHIDLPRTFTAALLDDVAADLPHTSPAPPASRRPAGVANDDWLTSEPRKIGGDDPPPPKPTSTESDMIDVDAELEIADDDRVGFTPSEWRAIRITTTFENGRAMSFGGLTGDFDGQGLSFGLLQWNFGTGSLQPLLRRFARQHAASLDRIFGSDAARLREVLAAPRDEQMTFVRSINDARNRIAPPWDGYFAALGDDPDFRAIELAAVRPAMDRAIDDARRFGLASERGLALMFDTVTQSGGSWYYVAGRRALFERRRDAFERDNARPPREDETMTLLANVVADTSLERFREDVRRRRMTIVTGQGTVHGHRFDLQREFGLSDRSFDASPSARIASPPADAIVESAEAVAPASPPTPQPLDVYEGPALACGCGEWTRGAEVLEAARAHAPWSSGRDLLQDCVADSPPAHELFEAIVARRAPAASLEVVGRGGARLASPLEPGDLFLRRLEGRRTIVGVVSDGALMTAEEATARGIPAEERPRARLVAVREPASRGGEALERARVALLDGDVVPYDQVIVRKVERRRAERAEDAGDAERAFAQYPASTLAWPDAPDGALDFMRAVYVEHVRAAASRRSFVDNVPERELRIFDRPEAGIGADDARALRSITGGRRFALHVDAVDDARRMLLAARAAAPVGVQSVGLASAYRSASWQRDHWQSNFARYYERTRRERDAMPGGPHGATAIAFMARYISPKFAAPGFSNHNQGLAIDVSTVETLDGERVELAPGTEPANRAAWRRTWLWSWLVANARSHGFAPLASEEWHWDHTAAARVRPRESSLLRDDAPASVAVSLPELIVCVGGATDSVTATPSVPGAIAWTIADAHLARITVAGHSCTVLGLHPGVTQISVTLTPAAGGGTATATVRVLVVHVELTLRGAGDAIVPAPENEDEAAERAAAGGNANLGPLPMGDGRAESPHAAFTSPCMVVGHVFPAEAATRLQFRWQRLITRRSWYIRLNGAGTRWTVTRRSARGPRADDTGADDFNDATPSVPGRRIYIYDNSALALGGEAVAVGDFIREEKDFIYRVLVRIRGRWVVGFVLRAGQRIVARRDAATGAVPADWAGVENSFAVRELDARITQAEARATVGGVLPIDIDPGAN